jgi:LysR family glycine cleavage system transcriptional activator
MRLRAFEASARLGSFVAAAGELRVSAAAVSQQVRRLEQYLDTPLFQRLARGLVLTEQGRDYLPELSAGFDLLGESTARVRAKRADGVLTLTTLAAFANGWLLPRLHRFRERAPRIDIVLRTSGQLQDFRRDAIDLAIRFAPAPGRGLHAERTVLRRSCFPVASPQLFGGRRMPDTLAALADYPLLHDTDAGPEQPWLGWRGWFERAGLSTANVARGPQFSDSIVLIGAAVAGLGIAIGRAPARRANARARPARARDAGTLDGAVEILPHRAGRAFPPARGAHVRGLGARGGATTLNPWP